MLYVGLVFYYSVRIFETNTITKPIQKLIQSFAFYAKNVWRSNS